MSAFSITQQQQLGTAARSPQSTVGTSDYRQNVNLLHRTTAAEGSCCLSSYTWSVQLPTFSSTTSSTSDVTPGGISACWQRNINRSNGQQQPIALSPTRSASWFLQKVCAALYRGFTPKWSGYTVSGDSSTSWVEALGCHRSLNHSWGRNKYKSRDIVAQTQAWVLCT